jgi:hypothetical protein
VAASLSVLPSALPAYPNPAAALARLRGFRAGLHACCTRRADALVDLADALLSAQAPVASLPRLSLEPAHRRGWGSTYAALARGRIDAERLRDLLADYPLEGEQPVYAVDVTTWPRCDAECSPERGYYQGESRMLDSPESVCAGQAGFEYPATSVLFSTTTRPGIRRASRSWPAGRSSGSASSALPRTPGPPRWTRPGCTRWTTPTSTPRARSARCLGGCLLAGRCRGLCSTPATTPRSCRWTWPTLP